jgi:formylglycine-generating enzyme required for sulfatase activity
MSKPTLIKFVKRLGLTLCVLSAVGIVFYFLALIALLDLAGFSTSPTSNTLNGSASIVSRSDGIAEVWEGGIQVAVIASHPTPPISADLVSKGAGALTSSADGATKLTRLGPGRALYIGSGASLWHAAVDSLWKSYGAPVAQSALWLVAQVAPLHVPETRKGHRGRTFKDCPDCPELVEIEAGMTFMGPLLQDRQVGNLRELITISRPFAVGKFSVTFDEWDACVTANGCGGHRADDRGWGRGRRPVIDVSWDDAKTYVAWLSTRTGKSYRLLTEAEREYVARGGTTSAFWWGDQIGNGLANCSGCGSAWDNKQTAPVGSFRPNAFGLYDLHGNVREWVEDCAVVAGSADTKSCPARVLRGGSWSTPPRDLRAAMRHDKSPGERSVDVGFRVARSLSR